MEAVSFDIGLTYHLPYLGNVSYTSMAHTKMFITYINKRKTAFQQHRYISWTNI